MIDSDTREFYPTMMAEETFSNIIQQVQLSNLNFQLQLSPFSAMISLKKTLLKINSEISLNLLIPKFLLVLLIIIIKLWRLSV